MSRAECGAGLGNPQTAHLSRPGILQLEQPLHLLARALHAQVCTADGHCQLLSRRLRGISRNRALAQGSNAVVLLSYLALVLLAGVVVAGFVLLHGLLQLVLRCPPLLLQAHLLLVMLIA